MKPGLIQQMGFIWLALPRENILPLTLLEANVGGVFQRVSAKLFGTLSEAEAINADIFSLFPKPKSGLVPKVGEPKATSFFNGHDILDFTSGLNLKTTKKIPLVGDAGLSGKVKLASKLIYSFKDVKHITVENDVLLEEHLNIVSPNTRAPGFLAKLQDNHIYVVTEVLQTTEFSVNDASDFAMDNNISAEAIEKYLEVNAQVQSGKNVDHGVNYKGETPVTFAVKAGKILFDKERNIYTLSKIRPKTVRGESKSQQDMLSAEEGVITIE